MSVQLQSPITVRVDNWEHYQLQPNQVYLFDPTMAFPRDSATECTLYFNGNNNFNSNNIVFNPECYEISDTECTEMINDNFESQNSQIPYQYITEGREVNEGLAVLEILYNNTQTDEPEFVDVNNLTETDHLESVEGDVLNISDDDDVIFVGEYINNTQLEAADADLVDNDNGQPRRNPVRKVRNSKASKDLEKDVYFEEDFAFLEQQDELEEMNRKMTSYIKKQTNNENFKSWPVNVHERPEFNEETNQIEKFDYTIRKIKEVIPKKRKPKFETVPKPSKKKKYIPKRRKIPRPVVEKKVPFSDLTTLINNTFNLVKTFCKSSEETGQKKDELTVSENGNFMRDKWVLLKNQALLSSIANNLDKNKIIDSFSFLEKITSDEV